MINKSKIHSIQFQAVVWIGIVLLPLIVIDFNNFSWVHFFINSSIFVWSFIVFYTNYFLLAPRYFFINKRLKYAIYNTILILLSVIIHRIWMRYAHTHFELFPPSPCFITAKFPSNIQRIEMLLVIKDIFTLTFCAIIATSMNLGIKFVKSENARKKAEEAHKEAEIRNFLNQLHPHFLLNTLNNIYALTCFSPAKAQEAILHLSKLLQYVLYKTNSPTVNLKDEITFMQNYIYLMKLRMSENIDIQVDFNTPNTEKVQIAPLLFISLIENAFKHGISSTSKSFIKINIFTSEKSITCDIQNSNFPKSKDDKSGNGIGLQLVKQRLDLCFPNKYIWEYGLDPNSNIYHSKLIIYDSQLYHH